MKESIMHCQRYETSQYNKSLGDWFYTHFMIHPEVCRLHATEKDVYKVTVRELKEGEESSYWGWWDNKTNRFEHVHPTRGILSMVFPYAMEEYVKRGDGKDYNRRIRNNRTRGKIMKFRFERCPECNKIMINHGQNLHYDLYIGDKNCTWCKKCAKRLNT